MLAGPTPTSWRRTPTSRSAVVTAGLVVRSANSRTPPSRRARPTTTVTGRRGCRVSESAEAGDVAGAGSSARSAARFRPVASRTSPDVGLAHEEIAEPDAVVPEVGLDVLADQAREADQGRVVARREEAHGAGLHPRGQPVLEHLVAPVGEP